MRCGSSITLHVIYIIFSERRKLDAKKNQEGRERSNSDYHDLALLLGEARNLVQPPTPVLSSDNLSGVKRSTPETTREDLNEFVSHIHFSHKLRLIHCR